MKRESHSWCRKTGNGIKNFFGGLIEYIGRYELLL